MTHTTVRVLAGMLEANEPLSGADFINQYGLFSGTLYPLLRRLEEAGWLKSYWENGDPKELGRPNRKFYELTAVGQWKAKEALSSDRTQKFFGPIGGTLQGT